MTGLTRREPQPHARERAIQRYGAALTSAELDGISLAVAEGRTLVVERGARGCLLHAVAVRGATMLAVVSPTGRVVTIYSKAGGGLFRRKRRRPA
jgi:hypothetical protein